MRHRNLRKLEQVCAEMRLERSVFMYFIEHQWITPTQSVDAPETYQLDEEDISRVRLILELRHDFGVNDEGIPIILHLLDQIYAIQQQLTSKDQKKSAS